MVTVHVGELPLHAPDQLWNLSPLAGVAVSVTTRFCG